VRFGACAQEREVGALLRGGQWPQGCGPELREHVAACARCSEMVLVRTAMQGLRAGDVKAARLEAPGVIWWRAQLRRRNQALEQVARPLKAAQLFALAVTVSFAAGFGVSEVRHSSEWLARLASLSVSSVVATISGWNLPLMF